MEGVVTAGESETGLTQLPRRMYFRFPQSRSCDAYSSRQ